MFYITVREESNLAVLSNFDLVESVISAPYIK